MLTSLFKGFGCMIIWLLTLPFYLFVLLFIPKSKRRIDVFYGNKSFLGIFAIKNIKYWFG